MCTKPAGVARPLFPWKPRRGSSAPRYRDDGWREAMVGTLSLYDLAGERQHTVYIGAAPEYGKAAFYQHYQQELDRIKAQYPEAHYLGIADGAASNWAFLNPQTERQLVDFYPVTEYLAKAAQAAYPEKTGQPQRQRWLAARCHQLQHERGATQAILAECRTFERKHGLSEAARTDLASTLTYFERQMDRMDYATHTQEKLPIGSGVTEAACKTLIKQRFCGSGMRWKDKGMKAVMTPGRWRQFWNRIQQYGVPVLV